MAYSSNKIPFICIILYLLILGLYIDILLDWIYIDICIHILSEIDYKDLLIRDPIDREWKCKRKVNCRLFLPYLNIYLPLSENIFPL